MTNIFLGNVQVDVNHLGSPHDMVVRSSDSKPDLAAWTKLSKVSQKNGSPLIAQINHPGRQSPAGAGKRGYFGKTIAPSAIPLNLGNDILAGAIRALTFGSPREMTISEIDTVVKQFVETAKVMAKNGFAGVEIHGAHGYLLCTSHRFHLQNIDEKLTSSVFQPNSCLHM